jgi:hypothetical protein
MSAQCEVTAKAAAGAPMSLFERYLTVWVFLCIIAGIVLGQWLPADQIDSYIAGLILLAAAPCTAMVFVWSRLTNGDPLFTLSRVALNDNIMVFSSALLVGLDRRVELFRVGRRRRDFSVWLRIGRCAGHRGCTDRGAGDAVGGEGGQRQQGLVRATLIRCCGSLDTTDRCQLTPRPG